MAASAAAAAGDLVFNAVDWQALRVPYPGRGADDDASRAYMAWTRSPYAAYAFGRDAEGLSIGLRIDGFRPYFYVRPPQDWTAKQRNEVIAAVMAACLPKPLSDRTRFGDDGDAAVQIPQPEEGDCIRTQLCKRKDLWGFTGGADATFLKFSCLNLWLFNRVKRAFNKPAKGRYQSPAQHAAAVEAWLATPLGQCRTYEANVDPMLRLIHERNLRSCGWIRVAAADLEDAADMSVSGAAYATQVGRVHPDPTMRLAPMRIASFDIECTSSHGDFPQAVKSYRKVAGDLYTQRAAMRSALDVERALRAAFRDGSVVPKAPAAAAEEALAAALAAPSCLGRRLSEVVWEVLRGRDASRGSLKDVLPPEALEPLVAIDEMLEVDDLRALRSAVRQRRVDHNDAADDARRAMLTRLGRYGPRSLPKAAARAAGAAGADDDDDDEGGGGGGLMDPAKDRAIYLVNGVLTALLPPLEGDAITNISTTVHRFGCPDIESRHTVVLSPRTRACGPVPGLDAASVVVCATERELIEAWAAHVVEVDPDVLCGFNIVGFDWPYVWARAGEVGAQAALRGLSRVDALSAEFVVQRLSSSALGDNVLKYLDIPGRLSIDLYKVIQREKQLESYKLDNVAFEFLGERKDDLPIKEVFRLFKLGEPEGLALIAKYCVQDCALVNKLVIKLKTIENNSQMANVCSVPLSYIFKRGQGVKILALVARKCAECKHVIPTVRPCDHAGCTARPAYDYPTRWEQRELRRDRRCRLHRAEGMTVVLPEDFDGGDDDERDAAFDGVVDDYAESDGYEGALVLEPTPGMYFHPITVLDFNSLYPSSMISENISHDSIVLDPRYDNLPGYTYTTVKWSADAPACRFAESASGEKAMMPQILQALLRERKNTRKKMAYVTVTLRDGRRLVGLEAGEGELLDVDTGERARFDPADAASTASTFDEFERDVLDGLQLSLKVTANSLYGQTGARTSPIHMKEIAACTTAVGREHIMKAKAFVEREFGAEVIYGDTDSIFIKFPLGGLTGKPALAESIRLGLEAERRVKAILKPPQALAYEKSLCPFLIMSKKRYVGLLYETDPDKKPKKKFMGIVLKRRDNPNVCKVLYSDVLDAILYREDVAAGVAKLREDLQRLVAGGFPLADMVMSKTLKAEYKDPTRIAHKVLAERMGARDPGTKPATNDRIPYVFVKVAPQVGGDGRPVKLLQGDRIEPPDYVAANGLEVDYGHYIQCQIMKPIAQLLALALDKIPGFVPPPDFAAWTPARREREVELLLFQPFIDRRIPGAVGREREMAAAAAAAAANPPFHRVRVAKDGSWTLEDATGEVVARADAAPDLAKESAPTRQLAAAVAGLDALTELTGGDATDAVVVAAVRDLHERLEHEKPPARGRQVALLAEYDEHCESMRVASVFRK